VTADQRKLASDVGLLFLRLGTGGFMLFGHGAKKLSRYAELSETFSDPLGVGSATSLALAVFAEVFCSILVMAGAATRAAVIPLVITMLVAALIIHDHDPWAKKEFALLYAIPFVALALTGAGRFSVDAWWSKRRRK
jgi:putative oxidoreductase